MFFTDCVKSSLQGGLNIADDGVYPFKFRHFDTFRTTTGYKDNMLMTALLKSSEAFKAIGHHNSLRSQMLLRPSFDHFFGKSTHLAEPNCDWMPLVTYGYCRDERDFPGSTSSSYAVMFFTSPVGIVCLYIFAVERFVESNMVPAVIEIWARHRLH